MAGQIEAFYNSLAPYYHLIFADWNDSIDRQARVLGRLLTAEVAGGRLKILDCACGIGTQTLGLAGLGHEVVASDLSRAEVERAAQEAAARGLAVRFHVSDMTSLNEVPEQDFDVVAVLDNALPHLSPDQLKLALGAIGRKLRRGGLFIASLRDYDALILERPTMQPPAMHGEIGERGNPQRIVHQVWDWVSRTEYTMHLFITILSGAEAMTHHFISRYRCLLRDELSSGLRSAGFEEVRWLTPRESGFYQPLVMARWP